MINILPHTRIFSFVLFFFLILLDHLEVAAFFYSARLFGSCSFFLFCWTIWKLQTSGKTIPQLSQHPPPSRSTLSGPPRAVRARQQHSRADQIRMPPPAPNVHCSYFLRPQYCIWRSGLFSFFTQEQSTWLFLFFKTFTFHTSEKSRLVTKQNVPISGFV